MLTVSICFTVGTSNRDTLTTRNPAQGVAEG
jgi:hypothetical protein